MHIRLFLYSVWSLVISHAYICQTWTRALIQSKFVLKVPIILKLSSNDNNFEGYSIDQSNSSERRPSQNFNIPTNPYISTSISSSSSFPSRQDTCLMLFSGVIGTQPKEIYLRQGNYVVRFSVR